MLDDFYNLMPQLYGENSCTHNCHLLSHLVKYVQLWGPLWTHSAFGFESKNGHLKHLFHGKTDIVHQIFFNIDVTCTLQYVYKKLLAHESEQTILYIDGLSRFQSNTKKIASHTYILGKSSTIIPSLEQSAALSRQTGSGSIEVFSRLIKNRSCYHSKAYTRSEKNKRNNTYCYYRNESGSYNFGVIEIFTYTPTQSALIRQLKQQHVSLLAMAGNPCRPSLAIYQEVDLLDAYITSVDLSVDNCPLISVPLSSLISKAVLISVSEKHFCIVQPNNIERH